MNTMIRTLARRIRYPRLGTIRLGIKVNGAPRETPYFVLPDDLKPHLGDKPTALRVVFPADELTKICPSRYERWQAGKSGVGLLTRACDGQTCEEIPVDGHPTISKPCAKTDYAPCPEKCTARARLHIVLTESGGPAGIYQILIGGEQRIADLYTSLEVIRLLTGGRLAGISAWIRRRPTVRQARDAQGRRIPITGYPVTAEPDFTVAQILKARGYDPAMLPLALAAGQPIGPVTPEHLEEPEAIAPGTDTEDSRWPPVEEFDLSLAFKEVRERLGVDPPTYELYLRQTYGTDLDNLPLRAYQEQLVRVTAAMMARETDGEVFRLEILAGAEAATQAGLRAQATARR
jgi:hypothetical protein